MPGATSSPRWLRPGLAVMLLALGAGLLSSSASPPRAGAQQVARAGAVQSFFSALEAGDLDGAVANFTEDALYVGSRACMAPNRCDGRDLIRGQLANSIRYHLRFTILSSQLVGSVVFGQYELRDDTTAAAGVDRIVRSYLAQAPTHRMAAFVSINDLTDAQTAKYLGVPQASTQIDRQVILTQWFQHRSTGDVDAALAGFTGDAMLISAPPCGPDTPCIGVDAIRARLQIPGDDVNQRYTVMGSTAVIQYEQRSAALRAAGIERLVVATIVQMPGEQMTLFVRQPDLTDSQTADNEGVPTALPN